MHRVTERRRDNDKQTDRRTDRQQYHANSLRTVYTANNGGDTKRRHMCAA